MNNLTENLDNNDIVWVITNYTISKSKISNTSGYSFL